MRILLCWLLGFTPLVAGAGDWRLAGTLQLGDGAVVLETPDGQQVVRIREYAGECRLDAVSRKAAVFTCSGATQTLRLGGRLDHNMQRDEKPAASLAETVQLARADVHARIEDRQRLVSELALEPVTGAAGIEGYRLQGVPIDSLAAQAGLQADDIVRGVNGVPVSAGSAFTQLLNELGEASQVQVEIERAGRRLQTLIILN